MKTNTKIFILWLIIVAILVSCYFLWIDKESESLPIQSSSPTEVEEGFKGDYLPEYSDSKYKSEVRKFLGTMIVNARSEKEKLEESIPVISEEDVDNEITFSLLHLDPIYLEEYAISVSKNPLDAYTVFVAKIKPFYEEMVLNSFYTRIEDLTKQVENVPEELEKVTCAKIAQIGDYYAFIICEDSEKVYESFEKVMMTGNLDAKDEDIKKLLEKSE